MTAEPRTEEAADRRPPGDHPPSEPPTLPVRNRSKPTGAANKPPDPARATRPEPTPAARPEPATVVRPEPAPAAPPEPATVAGSEPTPAARPEPAPAASPEPTPAARLAPASGDRHAPAPGDQPEAAPDDRPAAGEPLETGSRSAVEAAPTGDAGFAGHGDADAGEPAPADGDRPESIYRGRAKVGRPRTVRASAMVPGALSMPRPKPRFVPHWAKPSASFPRRAFPQAPGPVAPPPLRAPAPAAGRAPIAATAPGASAAVPAGRAAAPPVTATPAGAPQPAAASRADRRQPAAAGPAEPAGDRSPVPGRKRNRATLPALTAVLAAFAAGTGYLAFADDAPRPDLGRWAATATATGPGATAGGSSADRSGAATSTATRPPGDPFGAAPVVAQGSPTRLRIAGIGVDTPLESLHLGPDGALLPPRGFARAGWYADGTAPGDNGPAVIAGHVDSRSGPAVFYRLRELTAGDRVVVVRGGQSLTFQVTAVRWYPKSEFPTGDVYGPTPDRQLRLITCGGVFDRSLRSYRDNLVVYAVAA